MANSTVIQPRSGDITSKASGIRILLLPYLSGFPDDKLDYNCQYDNVRNPGIFRGQHQTLSIERTKCSRPRYSSDVKAAR
jgi:hypothetical protein